MQRKQAFKKALKSVLILSAALVSAILAIALSLGPTWVAKRFNPVIHSTPATLTPAAQTLHQSLTVVDLHADSLLWGRDLSKRSDAGHVDIPRLQQGNVALQIFAAVTKVPSPLLLEGNTADSDDIIKLALLQRWPMATWFSLQKRARYQAKRLKRLARQRPNDFRVIETQQDLSEHLAQQQTGQPVTAGLLAVAGAHVLEHQLSNINRLYDAGFRIVGLSHFFDNAVAGSAHGVSQGGLTPFGQQAIQQIESLHMLIDLAHASPQTIDDVLQIATQPVLVSHTGVRGTCETTRNLTDSQLRQIANNGGVVGIGFWRTAVCGEDIDAIVRAIRYAADHIGVAHVALGSDFDGAVRAPFDVSQLGQLTQDLQRNGFTDTEIQKIMGLNVVNLLQQYLPPT